MNRELHATSLHTPNAYPLQEFTRWTTAETLFGHACFHHTRGSSIAAKINAFLRRMFQETSYHLYLYSSHVLSGFKLLW